MVVSKKPNSPKVNIEKMDNNIEHVTSHTYLISLITEDGRSEKEIKRRIMIARTTFTDMRTLLSCHGINLKTKMEAFIKRRIPSRTTCSKALQYNSNKVVIKLKLY